MSKKLTRGRGGVADFARFSGERGLKSTTQRSTIAEAFFESDEHLSIEDLHHRVQEINPRIGYTTVYRTMKLLAEMGLAREQKFGSSHSRYEATPTKRHHDHLICVKCGTIVEFENEEIERLQESVAMRFGFEVKSHKMELYGNCEKCRVSAKKGR